MYFTVYMYLNPLSNAQYKFQVRLFRNVLPTINSILNSEISRESIIVFTINMSTLQLNEGVIKDWIINVAYADVNKIRCFAIFRLIDPPCYNKL